MGRKRSLNHHTISEHVLGSGAMTRTGSARMRHSHRDQREGKKVEKVDSAVDGGNDASIYSEHHDTRARGKKLTGRGTVEATCGVSLRSGSLTDMTCDSRGSSSKAPGGGSGQEAIA